MNSKLKLAAIINRRKSIRAFNKKVVSRQALTNCLEAARWAPSSSNNQPWRFIVVDKASSSRQKLEETLSRGNAWAKEAPVIVAVCAREKDDPSYEGSDYFGYDTGMAVMSFMLQAQQEGLRGHQLGGFDHKAAKKALKIPNQYQLFALIPLGHEGKLFNLDIRTRAKEESTRERDPLEDMAFRDKFGKEY